MVPSRVWLADSALLGTQGSLQDTLLEGKNFVR